ncbi:MAG: hypothetical protein IPL46_21855 [Saprospiraceae bacterium]|nr:hypothetical protein [Saprospiraceae bacterium]
MKLTLDGLRGGGQGTVDEVDIVGIYWASTTDGAFSFAMAFGGSGEPGIGSGSRTTGFSVRCIKD